MRIHNTQKGFALITALLIVALATIVSVNIATGLQLDVRRTGNMLTSEQSLQYVIAAENLLGIALYEDLQDNKVDYYGDLTNPNDAESWADIFEFPFENAIIKTRATDLQGCFNLNSLVVDDAVDTLAVARFKRLIANVLSSAQVTARGDMSQAVIDWLDNGVDSLIPDGAEDGYYMNLDFPYRTANAPMQSVSELRLVKGFENDVIYELIAPLVCAYGVASSINVNTAPEEVLNSLADDVDGADIIKRRIEDPFDDIDEFFNYNKLKDTIKEKEGLTVSTEYFLLTTEVLLGQSRTVMYSILHRDVKGETRVLARSQGAY